MSRFVATAMDGAPRAATLTQRMLAFSRQQPLAPTVVDANRLVAGMSELLRRTLGAESGWRPSWPAASGAPTPTSRSWRAPS